MALQAFMDESGTGSKQGPILMVSGYVSLHYWWEDFSEEWQAMLDKPPRIAYFRMKEAASLSGEFGNVGISQRNARLTEAIELIVKVAHASLGCVVPFGSYERIVKGKPPKELDSPLCLAMFDIMTKAVENQFSIKMQNPQEHVEPVDFVFDESEKLQPTVSLAYQLWQSVSPPAYRAMMGSPPIFRNDREFVPLQAADLQSWYFRRLFAEKFRGIPFPKGLPKELFKKLDNIPALMSVWDAKRFHALAKSVQIKRPVYASEYGDAWPPKLKNIRELLEVINLGEQK